MIAPKVAKLTARQEHEAYELATLRDLDTCQRCRRDCGPIARDHRQNRMAGNTVASNLQCLGLLCHTWKTEHPEEALAEGWAVPRHTTLSPAEWPARRWVKTGYGTLRLSWVLYDDQGEWFEIDQREADYRRHKGGLAAREVAA
jgi:hypothetical protein